MRMHMHMCMHMHMPCMCLYRTWIHRVLRTADADDSVGRLSFLLVYNGTTPP